jgi:hypothetical protein
MTNKNKCSLKSLLSVLLIAGFVLASLSPPAFAAQPDVINVDVYQNGVYYGTYSLKAADGWYLEVPGLPKEDGGGNLYNYTVVEHSIDGYTSAIYGHSDGNLSDYYYFVVNKEKKPEGGTPTVNAGGKNGSKVIEAEEKPVKDAEEEPLPVVTPPPSPMAIINLILSTLGAICVIASIIRILRRKKEGKSWTDKEDKQRRLACLIVAIVMGISGVLLFLLTENIGIQTTTLSDKWTIAHAAIFTVEIVCMTLAFGLKWPKSP